MERKSFLRCRLVLLIMIIIMLLLQFQPVTFADSGADSYSELGGKHTSFAPVYLDEIKHTLFQNRSKPVNLSLKVMESSRPLAPSEQLFIDPIQTGSERVFIPSIRERIGILIPYKINGTNTKHSIPSF